MQVALDVERETVRCLIPSRAVLLEALHDDPVQIAADDQAEAFDIRRAPLGGGPCARVAKGVQARRGLVRGLLLDDPHHLGEALAHQVLAGERRRPGEQLVQQHAERVDIAACIDIQTGHLRLLGAHVRRGADHLVVLREQRLLCQLLIRRLGDAEVDDLGHRFAVVKRDQHIAGLDVPMHDALLVGVLDRMAHEYEEFEAFFRIETLFVAVLDDGNALHELHYEVRAAGLGAPGIEHLGDIGVVHHRQRLTLGLEAGDDLPGIHAELDDLQRDAALHGLALLSHPHAAEAPLTNLLEQLVVPDHLTLLLAGQRGALVHACKCRVGVDGGGQCCRIVHTCEHPLDCFTQCLIGAACLIEIRTPFAGLELTRRLNDLFHVAHETPQSGAGPA